MRFSYFKTLSLPWQARIICEHGVRLAERKEENRFIELYQIDSFYAEVHYRYSDSDIIKITSFSDTCLLEPYLHKLSLPELTLQAVKSTNC
jgi:hypothetical protein